MKINILTLFPEMFEGFFNSSIIKRAVLEKKIEVVVINIRDFAENKHKMADDYPFGGGAGMVLKPEPLFKSLESIEKGKVLFTSPQGERLCQKIAEDLSKEKIITIIAGHYEGIDERVVDNFVDMEISIGDYVLTGGELAAMVIIDSVSRLIPGVISNENSYKEDSFYNGLLDYPHYTRPAEYRGIKVPEVLLSGNHDKIRKWRLEKSIERTYERRPELLEIREMTKEETKILENIKKGEKK